MGTLALVAGCSTADRAEVSGVVRDRTTGRVIAGARVAGADGSLAETDAEGRFHLYVNDPHADVRITAAGHSPEQLEIQGLDAHVDLAPLDETWGQSDGRACVVWVLDGGALDACPPTETTAHPSCTEPSLAQAHSSGCASCHADASARPAATCARCHDEEARAIESVVTSTDIAPHAGLGGACLACHSESASHGDARSACARCHGSEASTRTAELGRYFALATSRTLDRERDGTRFSTRSTLDTEVSIETVATWARALARDRSGGAHDPRAAAALARAITQ
jgi:hypothetical protein